MRRTPLARRSPLVRSSTWSSRSVRFTGPMPDVVAIVLERDHWCCAVCATGLTGTRGVDWSIHHRRPRRAGGDPRPETNLPANLVALCGSGTTGCHGWLESRRTEAAEMGLILHANDDPTQHPVAHAVLGPVLLDNAGGVWPVGEVAV